MVFERDTNKNNIKLFVSLEEAAAADLCCCCCCCCTFIIEYACGYNKSPLNG